MATVSQEEQSSSDDDGYKGVDLISESEGSEPDVEAAETRNIMESEDDNTDVGGTQLHRPSSPPPSVTSDWDGFDLDDGPFSAELGLSSDASLLVNPFFTSELELLNAANSHNELAPAPESKRVRFRDDVMVSSDTSCSNSSSDNDHTFPDLFLQQDHLDPQFRRMIENEQDNDDGGSGSTDGEGSYWDLRGSDDAREDALSSHAKKSTSPHPEWHCCTPEEFDQHVLDSRATNDDDSDSEGSSSGYETDEGETTDEEAPPPNRIAHDYNAFGRMSKPSDSGISPQKLRKSLNPPRRAGPSLGNWVADPSKPIAVIDSTGKRLIIYRAQRPPRSGANSGTSTINASPQTPFASMTENEHGLYDFSASLYNSHNLMLPGLLHGAPGNEFLLGGQVLGPPEAFYPFQSVGADGQLQTELDVSDDDDLEDDEQMLNVHDFIDFGDGSSIGDNENRDEDLATIPSGETSDAGMTSPTEFGTTSGLEVPASSPSVLPAHRLLDHFDRGVVTSFRRNQSRHTMLLKSPIRGPMSVACPTVGSGAIKGGRFAAANNPITPRRKRKMSLGNMQPPTSFVPRGSGANGHKRRKSGVV